MGSTFKLKPVSPRLNRNHPLARGLGLFLLMDDGTSILRNLAPDIGATSSRSQDVILTGSVIHRVKRDPSSIPAGLALECVNATSNFTKGTFRGTSMPDTGGVHTVDFQIQRRNVTNGYGSIIAENNADGIYLRSNVFCKPTVYFTSDHNATTDLGNVDDRQWQHYVIVNDTANSRGEFYLNGVADGTYSPTGFTGWTPDSMFNDSAGNRLQAWLNYVRVWYRALSAAEAFMLYRDPFALLEIPRKWFLFSTVGSGRSLLHETALTHSALSTGRLTA